jgi:hypothetical protein
VGKEMPTAALISMRHGKVCAANIPRPPWEPGKARGTCSAMPAYDQALMLALREILQKGGQFGAQRLAVSNK